MVKMLYERRTIFGPQDPVVVEVLQLGEEFSLVRIPLSPNVVINVLREQSGLPPIAHIENMVPTDRLTAIQSTGEK